MTKAKIARTLVWIGLILGLSAPVLIVAASMLTKAEVIGWETGFGELTVGWGPKLAAAGLAAGVVALAAAVFARWRWAWLIALVAAAAPAATLYGFWDLRRQAAAVPPIHDVSTDWEDPVVFSDRLMATRGPDANPVENDSRVGPSARNPRWANRRVAEINAETCPGARPIPRAVDSDRVVEVLRDMGLHVAGAAPWRVEAVDVSGWYGFHDDVAVRIRPNRTDVRSVSRVGGSDLGANCERVTEIVRRLSESEG